MKNLPETVISNLTVASLSNIEDVKRPFYERALHDACSSSPPPYGMQWFGEEFRCRGRDPSWLASLLVSNADMEGYSAGRLWKYGVTIADKTLSDGMLKHANDEAKHSKMFARILLEIFPELESEELKAQLRQYVPELCHASTGSDEESKAPAFEELLNSLILVNLFEVKALVLVKLLTPLVMAHAPKKSRVRVHKMMDVIIADEAHHIRYSADFIEEACRNGYMDFAQSAVKEFQATLNLVTESELAKDFKNETAEMHAGVPNGQRIL
jgi:hypothetical protein